jgi:ArsR family transcriptional regulator
MSRPNLKEEITQLHANICSAISDPRRILLLYEISEQPKNVSSLAESIEISQPAASRHLKVLHERGLVTQQRKGANVIYSIADNRLIDALDLLRDVLYDRLAQRAELLNNNQDRKEG